MGFLSVDFPLYVPRRGCAAQFNHFQTAKYIGPEA
jgi:hypothetical protein